MTPDEARDEMPSHELATRRVAEFVSNWGDGVIAMTGAHPLYSRDLAVLAAAADGPSFPTCGICDNEHPTEPADPGAFIERYIERFRSDDELSHADTEAVLEWARCIVGRYRDTVADNHNLRLVHQELSLDLRDTRIELLQRGATAAPTTEPAKVETYYGVRDRNGDINERPDLDQAVCQYDNMVAEAARLGFTEEQLEAAVIQREAVTTLRPWQAVDPDDIAAARHRLDTEPPF